MEILNKRQKKILQIIIEKYITEISSISSLLLAKTELKHLSSATIRNEMLVLEKKGFLKKENQTSGRIPTKKGYKFYIELLMGNFPFEQEEIKEKLTDIFSDRHASIDVVLDESVKLISEFLNLPIVLTQIKNTDQEFLKKIDITNVSRNKYIIYLITSSAQIHQNIIFIDNFEQKKDLITAVQLLNEILIDSPLDQINEKIEKILPILRKKVHQYEFIYERIISQLSRNLIKNQQTFSKVYNSKAIITQPEVQKKEINLIDIFNLLENYSTFSQLNFNFLKTGNTLINLENNIEGVSIASTILDTKIIKHRLSIIGPLRMNYPLIKYLLEFLNEKLSLNNKD